MKLSEKLKQDHECGDFGKALTGYAEEAERMERCEQKLEAMTKWLIANQPDVFSRGLWDALGDA